MPAAKPLKFRRRAVELAGRGDQSVAQIAKEFGISESCLPRWVSVDDVDAGLEEKISCDERKELVELRRRTRVLEMGPNLRLHRVDQRLSRLTLILRRPIGRQRPDAPRSETPQSPGRSP